MEQTGIWQRFESFHNIGAKKLVFTLFLLVVLTPSIYGADARLLLHFDESTGSTTARDSSGNGNDGTCAGGTCPTLGEDGKFNSAASFDGASDYWEVGDDNTIDFAGGDLTITAWIFPTTLGASRAIVCKTDGTNGYRLIHSNSDSDRLRFIRGYLFSEGPQSNNAVLTANRWHHIVASLDGGAATVTFYVNGVNQGNGGVGADSTTNANVLRVGWKSHAPSSVTYFQGIIDEVTIYGAALPADEIERQFHRGRWRQDEQNWLCGGFDCNVKSPIYHLMSSVQQSLYPFGAFKSQKRSRVAKAF